jgi:Recombinase
MRNRPKKGFYEDLTGRVFERLTVQGFSHSIRDAQGKISSVWDCICICGGNKKVSKSNLTSGSIVSCGCKKREIQDSIKQYSLTASVTHGCTRLGNKTQAYRVWTWMKRRCFIPTAKDYKFYGARGVTVCERWMKFENFLADMGEPPQGLTIDRYPDPTGNYEPSNCRWATWEQQHKNCRQRLSYADKPENIEVLRRILSLHASGSTFTSIADDLNSSGILSPRGKNWWSGGIAIIARKHTAGAL